MVRFANEQDLNFLKHIWSVCFQDPDDFIAWNFEQNFSYHDTLIAEWDGTPAANLQLMPHRIRLRGHDYDINYVSGVATLPQYQRKGLIRELFAAAFPIMQKRNQPISLLIPFQYAFYEKFGYKQCYEKTVRRTEAVPAYGLLSHLDLNSALMERLDRLYRAAMQDRDGYVLRTRETWRRILVDLLYTSKGKVLFHQTEGSDDGYALLTPDPNKGWEVQEQFGPCDLVMEEKTEPSAMARIIDVKRLLLELCADFDGCWRVKVVDGDIPQNNMTAALTKGTLTPCDDYDTEINIRQLAQLIFGFADDFTGTGLFPKTKPYINMIF